MSAAKSVAGVLDSISKTYPFSRISANSCCRRALVGPTRVHSMSVSVLGTADRRKQPRRLIRLDSRHLLLVTMAMYVFDESFVIEASPYSNS